MNESINLAHPFIKDRLLSSSVAEEAPVIEFLNHLLREAIQLSASDLHIEPHESHYRIRYRQHGLLYEMTTLPIQFANRLMARLKILAKLDVTEKRLPQDGRFHEQGYDFRLSICPVMRGEKVVLRLQNLLPFSFDMDQLGLTEIQKQLFLKALQKPEGLILVTGPTGSGKTATLYSALHYLNTISKNIATIEDPVEIHLKGINQVNVHPKIGLTFAAGLRALLRQDPDIIMIGEIRDRETADIAIHAAQTGHLVLSTLHSINSHETLTRLTLMGILPYDIASSLSFVMAQRLVRVLCPHCKAQKTGCHHCHQGHQGRIGIFECLPITECLMQPLINRDMALLATLSAQEGFITLQEQAQYVLQQGIISLEEYHRVFK